MKKAILFSLFALLFASLQAQDVIVKTDGEEIQSKVIEINDSEIKYKTFDNLDGPMYVMNRSKVSVIMYQNGKKEVFTNKQGKQKSINQNDNAPIEFFGDENLVYTTYKDVTINGKPVTKADLERMFEKSCPSALELFNSGYKRKNASGIMMGVSVPLLVASIPLFAFTDNATALAATFDVVGASLVITSIVLNNSGKTRIKNSYEMYNTKRSRGGDAVSLNFGVSSTGGLGVSLRF